MSKTDNIFGFPSEFASSEEKESKEYCLRYAQAIWYAFGGFSYYDERKLRYIELRKWAEGLQGIQEMKDLLASNGDTSYLNIDWTPISIVPKFVDVIKSLILGSLYKVNCRATDPVSNNLKDKAKAEMYATLFMAELEKQTGVNLVPPGTYVPKDRNEVDLYMELNYKQAAELAMELAMEYIFLKNDMDKITSRVVRDFIVLKIGSIKTYYTPDNRIGQRYVDVVNLVNPYSHEPDFSDIPYAGEIQWKTIGMIKKEAGDQFSEEEYYQIAQQCANMYGNARYAGLRNYNYYRDSGLRPYYDFTIPVLDFEFLSINTNSFKVKNGKVYDATKQLEQNFLANNEEEAMGKLFAIYPNAANPKVIAVTDKKKGKNFKISYTLSSGGNYNFDVQDKYKGSFIIDTNFIYNYGKSKNVLRKKEQGKYKLDTTLSFKIFAPDMLDMENKSHVERMIPNARQMHLAQLKLQQVQAKARPQGLAIDISGLQEVVLGKGGGDQGQGKAVSPLELQAIYDQTGNLYMNRTNADGSAMNGLPIQELANGLGKDVGAYMNIYNHNLKIIEDMSGINSIVAASSPNSEALVGVGNQAIAASKNAIRPLVDAYIRLMKMVCQDTSLMIQDAVDGADINNFDLAVGQAAKMILELGEEIPLIEMGIDIEYTPDDELKEYNNRMVELSLQQKTIRPGDAILIRSWRNSKQIAAYLNKQWDETMQKEMEKAQSLSENQGQSAAQAATIAEQAKQKTIEVQTKADAVLDLEKTSNMKDLETHKSKLKIDEIYAQAAAQAGADIKAIKATPQPTANAGA